VHGHFCCQAQIAVRCSFRSGPRSALRPLVTSYEIDFRALRLILRGSCVPWDAYLHHRTIPTLQERGAEGAACLQGFVVHRDVGVEFVVLCLVATDRVVIKADTFGRRGQQLGMRAFYLFLAEVCRFNPLQQRQQQTARTNATRVYAMCNL